MGLRFLAGLRAVGLLICLVVIAPVAQANELDKVRSFADQLAERALIIVKNEGLSNTAKQSELERLFQSHVDIPWVAKFVLGKFWRSASPEQQQAYLSNYEAFLLKNYSARLTDYTGQDYTIKNARKDEENEYTLTMELLNTNEPNVLIDYRIRKTGNDFKVFDIIVEGVSMITTQRTEFGSVVNNKGLDFLIDALKKKAEAKKLG